MFEVGRMKKFFLGLISGLCIALPISALADNFTMVGKTVEVEVPIKLDGEYLDVKAIGFEGVTYAPVRAFAEALGKEVDWDGEVIIRTPEASKEGDDLITTHQMIEDLKRNIASGNDLLEKLRFALDQDRQNGYEPEGLKKQIAELEQQIAEYERRLSELQATE